jgi:hypothetical protein
VDTLKLGGIPCRVSRSVLVASPSRVGQPPVELDDLQDRGPLRHCLRGDSAVSPLPDWCAGRWPFPLAPLDSHASPRVLQGSIPVWRAAGTKVRPLARSSGLVLSFGDDGSELSVRPRCSSTTPPLGGPSAEIATVRTPLLGLSKDRPSVDINTARPLPAPTPRERVVSAFGPGPPGPVLVPPLPFLPAPTAFSAQCLAGLLHPAANHGVRHV